MGTRAYLRHFELDAASGLAVSDGKVGRQRRMSDDGRERVPVLVC